MTAMDTRSIVVNLVYLLLVGLLAKLIYRAFFHPLHSVPGPWINSVSPIPSAFMLLIGRQNSYYYNLHARYGPAVRVSPDEVSFTGADTWKEIYGFRNGKVMEKSPLFIGVVSPMNGYVGIGLAKQKEHARQRRALAPGLSKNALIGQAEILQVHIDKLIKAVRELTAKGEAVNMSDWYSYVTFDIIGDLCFAEPLGCLEQGGATEWATSIINVVISSTWDQAIRKVAGVDTVFRTLLLKFIPKKVAAWRKLHVDKTTEKTLQRIAKEDLEHKDIMSSILNNEDSKKSLAPTEIILNMVLFLSAGSETTSISLTAWTYLICTNPEAYRRLAQEIRTSFRKSSDMTLDAVMNLSYLGATISEALRLFPPGAVNQQRVVPEGGAKIDNYFLPGGSTVSVSPWSASRSPLNFYKPNDFEPRRWLDDCPPEFRNDNLHASQPFNVGPKACIGKDLNDFETRLILSHLVWNFDFELERTAQLAEKNRLWDTNPKTTSIKVFQVLLKPDLWVRFKEFTH